LYYRSGPGRDNIPSKLAPLLERHLTFYYILPRRIVATMVF
jgi:hypothetical protein